MSKLGRVIVLTVPDFESDAERVLCYLRHALAGGARVATALRESMRLLDLDAMYNGAVVDRSMSTPVVSGFCRAVRQMADVAKEAKP